MPYLEGLIQEGDRISFDVIISDSGMYHLNFLSHGLGGEKINRVLVDHQIVAEITASEDNFSDSYAHYIYLEAGKHQITLEKFWGYIAIKGLEVIQTELIESTYYETVNSQLVNPNATSEAKRLMQFLADSYGKVVLSGQTANDGMMSKEFLAIARETDGKQPALLSLDFIDESASRRSRLTNRPDIIKHAKAFHEAGGIVTMMWHWNAPEPYLYDTTDHPWWSGFYTEHTTIDLEAIMNGDDPAGYDLLIKEMDEVADQLKLLQEAGIPILWRPLHEASGGWFWWGDSGPEPFIKLWQLMYDRYVNHHGLNHLIWVWNGQAKDWYPGDEYVDMIGEDIYPGKQVYTSQSDRFAQAMAYTEANKLIVLSENGCLPDPDLLNRDQVWWGYFTTWDREFVIDEQGEYSETYTDKAMLRKVYNHDLVLTLDELPDLSTYPME